MARQQYTVPFMLVRAGKYKTEDKLKTDNKQTKHSPQKENNTKHLAKQNYPGLVAKLLHSARK